MAKGCQAALALALRERELFTQFFVKRLNFRKEEVSIPPYTRGSACEYQSHFMFHRTENGSFSLISRSSGRKPLRTLAVSI
jgi:hypothetical protein